MSPFFLVFWFAGSRRGAKSGRVRSSRGGKRKEKVQRDGKGALLPLLACLLVLFQPRGGWAGEGGDGRTALFSGLDKVTARVSRFEVEVGRTAWFGDLRITVYECRESAPSERPEAMVFVEVDAAGPEGDEARVFQWMDVRVESGAARYRASGL